MATGLRLLLLLCAALLTVACSDDALSPEDEVRAWVEAAAETAERREVGELGDMVHGGYLDQQGNNRQQLVGMLRAYFFRNENIHLFTRISEIELLGDARAQVRLHVAMAGRAISGVDSLASLRAQIYRFELSLVRQDRWLLQHARWERASLADLH
jgi:hypothetical protein